MKGCQWCYHGSVKLTFIMANEQHAIPVHVFLSQKWADSKKVKIKVKHHREDKKCQPTVRDLIHQQLVHLDIFFHLMMTPHKFHMSWLYEWALIAMCVVSLAVSPMKIFFPEEKLIISCCIPAFAGMLCTQCMKGHCHHGWQWLHT